MFRFFSFPSLCSSKPNMIIDPSDGFRPIDFSNNVVTVQPEKSLDNIQFSITLSEESLTAVGGATRKFDNTEIDCCNSTSLLVQAKHLYADENPYQELDCSQSEDVTKNKINKVFNFKTLSHKKRGEDGQGFKGAQQLTLKGDLQKSNELLDPTWSHTALLPEKTVKSDDLEDFSEAIADKNLLTTKDEDRNCLSNILPNSSGSEATFGVRLGPIKLVPELGGFTKEPATYGSGFLVDSPTPLRENIQNLSFHEETQYLNLIREIIHTGSFEKSRNGNTYTKFGYNMRFSLRNGMIPILTTKKMAWKSCFEELFWFISGSTSSVELQKRGVNIWNGNGAREFLDSRGLYHLEEGDLGPIYGHQWRHFNAEYTNTTMCYKGEGIDQLKYIIDELSSPETRTSRRLIMTAWNPCQINQMALPPCHVMAQFHVRDNQYLSCALFQRSGDVGLGIPFNIASYALLTHILAKHCGLEAEEFVHFLGNCHIYEEHMEALKTQITLEPMIFPRINVNKRDVIEDYTLGDIEWVTPYHSHPPIKMGMKA